MAKAIYICSREASLDSKDEEKIFEICETLEPDNITSEVEHRSSIDGDVGYGIMNYKPSITIADNSVLLGRLYEENEKWDEPSTNFPDGSYAIFREDEHYLEVVTDPAGSRTIWYYFGDDLFLASTSQRAILMFLGNFVFDERVMPWMLSAGTLGPEYSWDKRLQRVPLNSSVILDKKKWLISEKRNPVKFDAKDRSREEHKELLEEAFEETMKSFQNLDLNEAVLTLSGGTDSRALLCLLDEHTDISEYLTNITWGVEKSIEEEGYDAYVARKLANKFDVPHRFYNLENRDESIEKVIDRYLRCSEGRVDQPFGFMDGMKVWEDLFEDDLTNVIRGDVGFSTGPTSSQRIIRIWYDGGLCSDFSNLKDFTDKFNLLGQELPQELERNENGSFINFRDRFYQNYRFTTILAAYSDVKYSYVEQINPLLSRKILERWRELPDHLRADKSLFEEIVNSWSPDVPYAKKSGLLKPDDVLRDEELIDLIQNKIQSKCALNLFNQEFIDHILEGITKEGSSANSSESSSLRKKLKELIPKPIEKSIFKDCIYKSDVLTNFYFSIAPPTVDNYRLAFRVYILIRMCEILKNDADRLKDF